MLNRFCFFGLWFRNDWLCSIHHPHRSDAVWEPLPIMHGHLKPQLSQRLWFRVRGRSVPRGWYLFVIASIRILNGPFHLITSLALLRIELGFFCNLNLYMYIYKLV